MTVANYLAYVDARHLDDGSVCEFFICVGDQPELDSGGHRNPDGQGFAAFGRVVAGGSTVRKLCAQGGDEQFLKSPIAIRSVRRVREEDRAEALRLT